MGEVVIVKRDGITLPSGEGRSSIVGVAGIPIPASQIHESLLNRLRAGDDKELLAQVELRQISETVVAELEPVSDDDKNGEPIDGYDDLDVHQVVAVLRANSDDEDFIENVMAYESEHKGRRTVLGFTEDD